MRQEKNKFDDDDDDHHHHHNLIFMTHAILFHCLVAMLNW